MAHSKTSPKTPVQLVLGILLVAVGVWIIVNATSAKAITNYDECVAAGNPTLKIYPGKCITKDGQTFVQIIPGITTFEQCAQYYPVMESYPEQCHTPDGRNFVRDITGDLLKGHCATTISVEGAPNNPDPYMHQREECGKLKTERECENGGTDEWLAADHNPFSCEWQSPQ